MKKTQNKKSFDAEAFNPRTRREISQSLKDISAKKNLSSRFANAREVVVYLNSI